MPYRVALYSPDRGIIYDGRTPDQIGVGGGITARVSLLAALAARGHDVTAHVNCLTRDRHAGVEYVPLDETAAIDADILIAISTGGALSFAPLRGVPVRARLKMLWVQGVPQPAGLDAVGADYTCVASHFLREVCVERWGLDRDRMFVCYNGIHQDRFVDAERNPPPRDPFALVYIGPPEKGLGAAIDVLARLRETDDRYHLDIFGGSALWGMTGGDPPSAPGVAFQGLVGQSVLTPRLFAYEYCLAPQAMEEGFGIAVQEARRAGAIVLASAVGAFRELIADGVDGFLIEAPHTTGASRDRMSALILELAADPARRAAIRTRAQQTSWSWQDAADRWTAFWDQALAATGAAAMPVSVGPVPSAPAVVEPSPTARNPQVLIGGYYGHGNTGDEAILRVIVDQWRRAIPEISLIVASADPAQTRRDYQVAAVHERDIAALIDAAGRSDLVVLGGGGLFQDYFGLDEATLLSRGHWGLSYFAAFPALAILMRRPFAILGAGVGPLLSDDGQRYTRLIFERAEAATLRDGASRDLLRSIGVAAEPLQVAADPAFLLESAPADRVGARLDRMGVPASRSCLVAVAIRQWTGASDPDAWQPAIAAALDSFIERYGATVLFVSFQATTEDALTDDRAVAHRIRNRMQQRRRAIVGEIDLTPAEMQGVLGAADLVLAMRLHAVILAGNAQVPVVALAYDPKVRRAMQQLGVEECTLELPTASADAIRERMAAAYVARGELRNRLATAAEHIRPLAERSLAPIIALTQSARRTPAPPSAEWTAVLHRALLDRTKRAEEMDTRAEHLTAELRERSSAAVAPHTPPAAPAAAGHQPAQRHDLSRLLAERTQELVSLATRLGEVEAVLARRPGHTGRRIRRWLRHAGRGLSVAAAGFVRAGISPLYRVLQAIVRSVVPAAARDKIDRELLHGLMSGPAYAFDRYKRTRVARYGASLAGVRAPGQVGLVSIVLPVYNGAAMIAEAIDSVLVQTYTDFELIVVNDGSTDDTPRIVDAYARRDERVRVIDQDNRKLPIALSRGQRAANGEFLTWTSADNRLKPEFLERMVDCLRRHPDWDMAYANLDIIGEDGQPLKGTAYYDGAQHPPGSEHIHLPVTTAELNVRANNSIGAAFLYRSRVAYLLGDYSKHRFVMEDYDYWMRVNGLMTLRHTDFVEPVSDYRFHAGSLTARWAELDMLRNRERLMVFDDFRRDFYLSPALWIIDPGTSAAAARLIEIARTAGHLVHDGRIDLSRLPRLSVPVIHVRWSDGNAPIADPPTDLPPHALKVLVVEAETMPDAVSDDWDLCCAFGSAGPLRRRQRDYQGWVAVAQPADVFHLIDVRAKASHLELIERLAEQTEPPIVDASVIVCTRGLSDRLISTLRGIASQDASQSFEILVVNNDPAGDSAALAAAIDRLREGMGQRVDRIEWLICPIPGLSAARNAGLAEARGGIVCFLDDDAVPARDWLSQILDAFRSHAGAGVVGGHIKLETPEPRPAAVRPGWTKYWSEYVTEYSSYTEIDDWRQFPWGANWCARRQALLQIGGFRSEYGRKGNNYGGGEELVAALLIRRLGYTVGIEPAALVTHAVDPSRLTTAHVRQTIVAGHLVGHRAQQDLYLPRPGGAIPGLGQFFARHADPEVKAGSGRWLDAVFLKQAQVRLIAAQLRDVWRRARRPIVDERS